MLKHTLSFMLAAMQVAGAQPSPADAIPGYRHTAEKSRFFTGASLSGIERVAENDFVKYWGPSGVLAMDEKTGLTMAARNASQDKASPPLLQSAEPGSLPNPDTHNKQVLDYFVQAGLPRDQVDLVHANTYLSASGPTGKPIFEQPNVDGYATIVSRKAGEYRVVDSVAWARMGAKGSVLSEWVYWPPIPSNTIEDARRLNEVLNGRGRDEFLSKLPSVQKSGHVVIRHSSPFAGSDFKAFASYDVVERTESRDERTVSVHVRHFDIDAKEIYLPQEMRGRGAESTPKDDAQSPQK